MRNKILIGALLSAAALTTVSAHVMVSPLQSKPGASQKYEVRVHNEAKVAATTIDLTIPDGVIVTDVAKPASGSYTTKTTGNRITSITWQVDVQPSKYVALPFTATNPGRRRPTCTGTCANISPTVRSSTGATSQDRRRRVPSPSSPEPPTERRVVIVI